MTKHRAQLAKLIKENEDLKLQNELLKHEHAVMEATLETTGILPLPVLKALRDTIAYREIGSNTPGKAKLVQERDLAVAILDRMLNRTVPVSTEHRDGCPGAGDPHCFTCGHCEFDGPCLCYAR